MTEDKFCLKWNDFESNIKSSFKELREEKDLFDVWLTCDNGEMQAHKLVLSACSNVMKQLLRRSSSRNSGGNHVVYLRGVSSNHLQYILDFMYHGEVSLAQDELNSFLLVAEDLQVKGLSQKKNSNGMKTTPDPLKPTKKLKSGSISNTATPSSSNFISSIDEDEIQEIHTVKQEVVTADPGIVAASLGQDDVVTYQAEDDMYHGYAEESITDGYEEVDVPVPNKFGQKAYLEHDQIDAYISEICTSSVDEFGIKTHFCGICQMSSKARQDVDRHIESHHIETPPFQCQTCGSFHKNRRGLKVHSKTHK